MRPVLLLLVALVVAAPRTIRAQESDTARVYAVVVGLFDAMRTRDTAAMRAAFDSTAVLQSVGANGIRRDPIAGWLNSVANAPQGAVLDERLGPPRIAIDGALATVWVRYHFFVGERFSHCGVDAFTLGRVGDRWRILSVADTRQRDGCPPLDAP